MILVTGAAGFIGYHLCETLLARGEVVVGIDNLNAYYDPSLKEARLARLARHREFRFLKLDLADRAGMETLFRDHTFEVVYHLAAQAGVRWSLDHPHDYAESNLTGFLHVLEGCRHGGVGHLVYASSSSVYGLNRTPFSTEESVDHPVSLYAATKKANELMAHSYAHLYGLPCTGLRLFTVYGPWGRPDMATWLFADAIMEGRPIRLFNHGNMKRDFTYVDDVVEGFLGAGARVPTKDDNWQPGTPLSASSAPWRIYNIGNHKPEDLRTFVAILEEALGRKAIVELHPLQPGDVEETCADLGNSISELGYLPKTSIQDGLPRFASWFRAWRHDPATLGISHASTAGPIPMEQILKGSGSRTQS